MGRESWNVRTRSISIPKKLDQRLVQVARETDRTISRMIVRAIEAHLLREASQAEDEEQAR